MKAKFTCEIPKRKLAFLTPGKEYEVENLKTSSHGRTFFDIVDNEGDTLHCLLKECAHLEGGDWTLIGEKGTLKKLLKRLVPSNIIPIFR